MKREISLLQATSINMIDMVGIGPFVMMTIVMSAVGSNLFLWAWVFGAITALVDGMIWSELGAAYPLAGGSYNFLKEAYGTKYGPMMSFLFVWQTCLQAPLVIASAAIGFAHYFGYLFPLGYWGQKAVSGTVVIVVVALLYRNIWSIGKMAVFLWSGVIITILWIIISGFTHRQVSYSCVPSGSQSLFSWAFFILVGRASVGTIYSFLGYYNVCHLGGEIRDPGRNIPRSIFISIICIAALYLAMNISIVGVIPWQQAMHSDFVVSLFMEKIYGTRMAQLVTLLILWIAFASLFAVVLGYSRVPYAAAADGHFFPFFAWLHPKKDFPYVSLLFIGALGFLLSLTVKLEFAIKAILAMRILVQFVAQAVGVVLLRRSDARKPDGRKSDARKPDGRKPDARPGQRGAAGPTGRGASSPAGRAAADPMGSDTVGPTASGVAGPKGRSVADPTASDAGSPTDGPRSLPFKMWLYPLPVVLSIAIWLFVWYSTGIMAIMGLVLAAIGGVVFFLTRGRWQRIK